MKNRIRQMNRSTRTSMFTYTMVIVAFVIIQLLRTLKEGGVGSVAGGPADPHLRLCGHGFGAQPGGGYFR